MPTPGSYYDLLPARIAQSGIGAIDENLDTLRELEILLDGDHHRAYMLQIFLKEAAGLYGDPDAGPFFYEIIQRKGDSRVRRRQLPRAVRVDRARAAADGGQAAAASGRGRADARPDASSATSRASTTPSCAARAASCGTRSA